MFKHGFVPSLFQSTPPVKAATHGFGSAVTPRKRFQSTPPVKAATVAGQVPADYTLFQSTPPVKAATDSRQFAFTNFVFQSTPPVKAATPVFVSVSECLSISIHAAREGGDHNS